MLQAASNGIPVPTLARKAPKATPMAMRQPKTRSAASAIPLGAHTMETVLPTTAYINPTLAAAKYSKVTPSRSARGWSVEASSPHGGALKGYVRASRMAIHHAGDSEELLLLNS
jgi:hypothetical protein